MRFFAVAWTTAPVRLIGIFFPSQIEIATIAYGITTYSQIGLPLIITITSKLNVATKSLIITLLSPSLAGPAHLAWAGASTAPKLIDAMNHDAAVLKQKEAHNAKSFTF